MSKYHNRKTEVNGVMFDSSAEALRYRELLLLVTAGEISELFIHPKFQLDVNNIHLGCYIADFQYNDHERQKIVVEDVKGVKTPVYRLKKKLMKALYGIEIFEVQA